MEPIARSRIVSETACPLDCPDSCSLSVTTEGGRIVKIDGSRRNEVTQGFICGKVRRFDLRVYDDSRLLYPAVRKGAKGAGRFERVSWDHALDLVALRMREAAGRMGAESVLPFCDGGSNGPLTQDSADARLFGRFGASRLERTVCSAPTSTANQALYGKMAGVSYLDYPHARLVVLWGVNPSASGIHLIPYLREAQRSGAKLVVVDPRSTQLARGADLHLAPKPGTDVALALALHRYLFESGHADEPFLARHSSGWERLRDRASEWTFDRAAEVCGLHAAVIEDFARLYAESAPALVRCGWGLERNRNGGNAAMAILALPAVAGKFGVRGGGYSMSNSAVWSLPTPDAWLDSPEGRARSVNMTRLGRALLELSDPPIGVLFVYNCNPVATMPDQNRVIEGLRREDLFTVVFEQVLTDTARYADVILPATTFLEGHDLARGYGPISLQRVRPVIEPRGEARTNVEVFSDLSRRLGLSRPGDPEDDERMLDRFLDALPAPVAAGLREGDVATSPVGTAPVQFVDVFPKTVDGRIHFFDEALDRKAPAGLYAFQPDPATEHYPLTLISPATERTISSSLGELRSRPARLLMHPVDALPRGVSDGDEVRVFNELGEVRCHARVADEVRPGTVSLPKGLWCKDTLNGLTSNALSPDSYTDLGDGACFNDARVQIERALTGNGRSGRTRST